MNEIATSMPVVLADSEGETIVIRGARVVVKAAAPRVTLVEYTAPAGFPGPPLHVHPGFDEVFFVLEGAIALRLHDEVHELGPGGSAHVDGDAPHTFANPTAEPVRFLVACTPRGFEDYFRTLAAGDDEAIAAVRERFGVEYVPSAR